MRIDIFARAEKKVPGGSGIYNQGPIHAEQEKRAMEDGGEFKGGAGGGSAAAGILDIGTRDQRAFALGVAQAQARHGDALVARASGAPWPI